MSKHTILAVFLTLGAIGGILWAAYPEDAPHVDTEMGELMLGVRTDTRAALSGTTGDRTPPQFTSNGDMRVRDDDLLTLLGTAGGGAYVRQDSTATIAKEAGGNLAAAATSLGTIAGDTTAVEAAVEASGWTVATKAINVGAGTTGELVAAAGSGKRIRVVGLFGTTNVSGSITLKSASTALSGVINLSATSGPVLPAIPAQNIPLHGWCQTAANEALNLTTVTCEFDGFLIYATEN